MRKVNKPFSITTKVADQVIATKDDLLING